MQSHSVRFGVHAQMYVLTALGGLDALQVEKHLTERCCSFLENAVEGGGAISKRADALYFVYLVTSV